MRFIGVLLTGIMLTVLVGGVSAQQEKTKPAEVKEIPAKVAETKIENLAGGTKTLADFRGKVVLLVLSGRQSRDAAARLSLDISEALREETDLVRVNVADLRGLPGFLRGMVRSSVRDSAKKGDAQMTARLKAKNIPMEDRYKGVLLLDWRGDIGKALGVSGKTDTTYQAFVLDRDGKVKAHFTQPEKKEAEDATRQQVQDALIQALKEAPSAEARKDFQTTFGESNLFSDRRV